MKRQIMRYTIIFLTLLCGVVFGDGLVISSATSDSLVIDTRAGKGLLVTDCLENIVYSNLWDGDTNAMVTIAVNGQSVKTAMGEGVYAWMPLSGGGIYTLTHRTTKDGIQIGEILTTTFSVASSFLPTVPLGIALDNTSLMFDTDGDASWYGVMDTDERPRPPNHSRNRPTPSRPCDTSTQSCVYRLP